MAELAAAEAIAMDPAYPMPQRLACAMQAITLLRGQRDDRKQNMTRDIQVASGVCWDLDQLRDAIAEHDRHNEIIKVEITHGFEPGRKCYRWIIWAYPPLDRPATYDDADPGMPITNRCAHCGDVIALVDGTWEHRPGSRSPHEATPSNLTTQPKGHNRT